jgi:hypothetical protein
MSAKEFEGNLDPNFWCDRILGGKVLWGGFRCFGHGERDQQTMQRLVGQLDRSEFADELDLRQTCGGANWQETGSAAGARRPESAQRSRRALGALVRDIVKFGNVGWFGTRTLPSKAIAPTSIPVQRPSRRPHPHPLPGQDLAANWRHAVLALVNVAQPGRPLQHLKRRDCVNCL